MKLLLTRLRLHCLVAQLPSLALGFRYLGYLRIALTELEADLTNSWAKPQAIQFESAAMLWD